MSRRPCMLSSGCTSIALAATLLASCASSQVPPDALRLTESTLEIRSLQTRTFTGSSSNDFIAATIAALQDMEFNVDRIEKSLGVITVSKISDADSSGQKAGLLMLDVLCGMSLSGGCNSMSKAHDRQKVTATLVILPSLERSDEFVARITIQRVIFDKAARIVVLERVDDAATYQQVFERIAKATFIQVSDHD